MKKSAPILSQMPALTPLHKLETLVEHRSVYTLEHCEMNIFETHQYSANVELCFDSLTFTAMLRGKKIMHLFGSAHFEYLPGESVVVPAGEQMLIDFPEASQTNPTQCIALAIDHQRIQQILDLLNEKYKKIDSPLAQWQLDTQQYHLKNSADVSGTIERLIRVSTSSHPTKDLFAEFALQELLIHLMQSQARNIIFEHYEQNLNRHRFAYLVKYIKEHLSKPLTVKELSNLACMSESNFFKSFKRELGISPIDYVLQERLARAKQLLTHPDKSITDICFELGFNSVHYFSTIFKKYEKISPKQYRQHHLNLLASRKERLS